MRHITKQLLNPYVILSIIIILLILGVASAFWYRDAHKYNPIDFTKSQPAVRQPPVFHINDIVTIEALFINRESENITFNAKVYWQLKRPMKDSISPDSSRIFQFEFNRVLNPGCTYLSFDNVAPSEVRNLTARLFSDGHKTVTWEINGTNKVIEPKVGDQQTFHTQEFTYYHNSAELPEFKNESKLSCDDVKEAEEEPKEEVKENAVAKEPTSQPKTSATPTTQASQKPTSPAQTKTPPNSGGGATTSSEPEPEPEEPQTHEECTINLLGVKLNCRQVPN